MPTINPLARWRILIKAMGGGTAPAQLTTPFGVATTNLLTSTGHGLIAGDRIQFTSLTGGAGITVGETYRISTNGLTLDDFKISSMTLGGVVDFTTNVTAGTWQKVGALNATEVTVNAETFLWTQNATTGIIDPYPHAEVIAAGGPYSVEEIIVPFDPTHGTGGSFWKFLEGPGTGKLVSQWSNALGYGDITVNTAVAYDRGPGALVATIEYPAAHSAGASLVYNSTGEVHFTMLVDDPLIDLLRPKRQHYMVEFLNVDGVTWDEVYAGILWDFEATDTEVVYYGIDYLGALQYVWDERYDINAADKAAPAGSKYNAQTISDIITAQLTYAIGQTDSLISFLSVGTVETMSETVTLYSTMQDTLSFCVGLINSHRAGTGKMSRISVDKSGASYVINVTEDPSVHRDDLALQYVVDGLVEGYQAIPFGTDWASRVNVIGQTGLGEEIKTSFLPTNGPVSQSTFGRITQAPVIIQSPDENDLKRRARQAALDAGLFGKQIGVGVQLGSFRPLEDYNITDAVPVAINHGAVNTGEWGSDLFGNDPSGDPSGVQAMYWNITSILWESFDDGHWETNLGLWPTGGGTTLPGGISTPNVITPPTAFAAGPGAPDVNYTGSRTYLDTSTGQQYVRNDDTDSWDLVPGTVNPQPPQPGILTLGMEGEEGPEGMMGPPGPAGADGAAGAAGAGGPPGMDGRDGEDGEMGFPGPPGPGYPFSGCRVGRATDWTIPNATNGGTIPWTSEEYDTDTYHDNSTNNTRLTVPAAGYYEAVLNIYTNEMAAGKALGCGISTSSGGEVASHTPVAQVDSLARRQSIATGAIYLAAGAYFTATIWMNNASDRTLWSASATNFTVRRVA